MANVYGLKAIKLAGGDETPRFEAKIARDGKVFAIVHNEGCGGENFYTFLDEAHTLTPPKDFDDFIKQWGIDHKENGEIMDIWVYTELDKHDERKMLLRRAKTMTPFRVKGDPKDEWRMWKRPYCDVVKKAIEAKYGDKVETIFTGAI